MSYNYNRFIGWNYSKVLTKYNIKLSNYTNNFKNYKSEPHTKVQFQYEYECEYEYVFSIEFESAL